jgi:acyl carrier protein
MPQLLLGHFLLSKLATAISCISIYTNHWRSAQMTAQEVVINAIAQVFELSISDLTPATSLDEFAADSVGLVVVADIAEAAGWFLDDEALKNARSINDLIASAKWMKGSNQI